MPFVSNMQDDEQNQNLPQGAISPTGGGTGVHLSPQGAVPTVGGSGGKSPASAGGQFASLNQYLSANQGQAEPLAAKLTSGIGRQYNTLQGQNTATLNDINSQIAGNALPSNANDIIAQEAANPVSFTSNASNIPSFQKLLTASYSGPTSAESTPGFSAQQNAINNAINTGQQSTQTEAGRENLLAQNETTPTTGVTALNSAILSQSPTALSSVESAYKPFSNLLTGLQTGAQAANQNIAQTQNDITAANTKANQQIANQINALNTNLTTTANQDTALQNANNAAIQNFQSQLNPVSTNVNSFNELMQKYFPTATSVVNPISGILNTPVSNNLYTPQSVATAEDAARAQAFTSLLNGITTGAPTPLVTQAGTLNAPTQFVAPNPTDVTNQIYESLKPIQWGTGQDQNLLKTYQDTQNWQNQIDPAFAQLLQSLNKVNPTIWAPPA